MGGVKGGEGRIRSSSRHGHLVLQFYTIKSFKRPIYNCGLKHHTKWLGKNAFAMHMVRDRKSLTFFCYKVKIIRSFIRALF